MPSACRVLAVVLAATVTFVVTMGFPNLVNFFGGDTPTGFSGSNVPSGSGRVVPTPIDTADAVMMTATAAVGHSPRSTTIARQGGQLAAPRSSTSMAASSSGWSFFPRNAPQCGCSIEATPTKSPGLHCGDWIGSGGSSNNNNRGDGQAGIALPLRPRLTADEARRILPPDGSGIVRPALGAGRLLTHRAVWNGPPLPPPRYAQNRLSAQANDLEGTTMCDHTDPCRHLPNYGNRRRKPHVILAVGHSHTRYMLAMLCMMGRGGPSCELFDRHERNVTVVIFDALKSPLGKCLAAIIFVQANFDLRNKLWQLLDLAEMEHMEHLKAPSPPPTLEWVAHVWNGRVANVTSDLPPFGTFPWPPFSKMPSSVTNRDSDPVEKKDNVLGGDDARAAGSSGGSSAAPFLDGVFSDLKQHSSGSETDDEATSAALAAATRRLTQGLTAARKKSSLLGEVTNIVVSRGSWDLLFFDPPPLRMAAELSAGLNVLQRAFPEAALTVHMPHEHVWDPPGYDRVAAASGGAKAATVARHRAAGRLRATWRRTCFAEDRQQRIRDANLCALAHQRSANTTKVFDFFTATSSTTAKEFVDGLGHHYLDAVLEEMSFHFLRHLANAVVDVGEEPNRETTASLLRQATEACDRLANPKETYTPVIECSCMMLTANTASEQREQQSGNATSRGPKRRLQWRDRCAAGVGTCCSLGKTIPAAGRRT